MIRRQLHDEGGRLARKSLELLEDYAGDDDGRHADEAVSYTHLEQIHPQLIWPGGEAVIYDEVHLVVLEDQPALHEVETLPAIKRNGKMI